MAGDTFSVRRCGPSDRAEWIRLRQALWPHVTAQAHAEELAVLIEETQLCGWLVSDRSGPVVGFAEVSIRPYATGCTQMPVAFLEGIYLETAYRRQGLGRLLIEQIERDYVAKGFTELCSDAPLDNDISHQAHARWGFDETQRVVYFRKPLD